LSLRFECSADAIGRHAKAHLSPVQRAALLTASQPTVIDLETLSATESAGLLAQLVAQRGRLQVYAEAAAELGDVKAATSAESVILSNLATVGKLLGTLVQRHAVTHTNLLISPDYLKLRATLMDALRPFPVAARSVGAALHRLEADAATDITAAASKRKDRERWERPEPIMIEHDAAVATGSHPAPPPSLLPLPY
jgi:hypothetical protein